MITDKEENNDGGEDKDKDRINIKKNIKIRINLKIKLRIQIKIKIDNWGERRYVIIKDETGCNIAKIKFDDDDKNCKLIRMLAGNNAMLFQIDINKIT